MPHSIAHVNIEHGVSHDVPKRLFGSFVEHLGRTVYTGVYEPGHPSADELGFRGDVARLAHELGVTTVRYPGGNFVSGYRWEDGVGPQSDRPRRLDLAWRQFESNRVGTDDFLGWCDRYGFEPMLAVNLGTRGVEAAADLVEYVNLPSGTRNSDWRRANGRDLPWGVKIWCLGNEMDGPWQIGHKTAREYGRLAAEAGKAMRRVDPTIELVACGSSNRSMPTFGDWERAVLEETWDVIDHLSLHAYYEEVEGDTASFLGSGEHMRRFIGEVIEIADAVGRERGSTKRITLSFDEWNVWYQGEFAGEESLPIRDVGPLFEQRYSPLDAVVVGDLMISLLAASDRVRAASLAQLVNSLAPIMTEPGGAAWKQPTFYPIREAARSALDGQVRASTVQADVFETAQHGKVPAVNVVALRTNTGSEVLLATNRCPHPVAIEINNTGTTSITAHRALRADGDGVKTYGPLVEVASRGLLPPQSWSVIEWSDRPSDE